MFTCRLLLVEVRHTSIKINTLHLLNIRANNISVGVVDRFYPQVVHVEDTNYIGLADLAMLLAVFLIAQPRDDELVLSRFTAFDVVLRVEERPIRDEQRHFESPMVNREIILLINGFN